MRRTDIFVAIASLIYTIKALGDCNVYQNAGPLDIAKKNSVGTVTPTPYFEIEFDIEFKSLCYNPSGNWGNDAICGVLQIGGETNHLGERYPVLFTGNRNKGNSENYWYTRLQTSSSQQCCGNEVNFLNQPQLTAVGSRHHVYVAITPTSYTVNIDGIENKKTFTSRFIPSKALPIYFSGVAERPADAKLYDICIRSSSTKLWDPCDGVTCPSTGNLCSYTECDKGKCIGKFYKAGHSCADNTLCNGNEACDGNGKCQAGIPVQCDDANICTDDICDPKTGICSNNIVQGKPCPDGDLCNGLETCNANGVCSAGEPVVCPFGEKCDAGQCVVDCDVFAIDKYNAACSAYPTNEQLQKEIDALKQTVDDLKKKRDKRQGKQAGIPAASLDLVDKDMVIISILVVNMILFLYICCYRGETKRNKSKYKTVEVYSSEDEDKPMNKL